MLAILKQRSRTEKGLLSEGLLFFGLALFGSFPLLVVIWDSLQAEGAFSPRNYLAVYQRPANFVAVVNTLEMATLSMLIATTMAFLLAWLLERSDLPGRGFLRALFLLPYLTPPFVGAIAWTELLNPRVGYLNRLFMQIFGLPQAPFDIYSLGGLVWVMSIQEMPLALLAISTVMQRIDPAWEEAARLAGAGRLRMIRQITLPVVLPGVLAGAMLVFVSAASAFGVPAIIGMPARIYVVTTRIVSYVYMGTSRGMGEATALAVLLMAAGLLLPALVNRWTAGRSNQLAAARASRPGQVELGRWRRPLFFLCLGFGMVAVAVPLATVVGTSFLKATGLPLAAENLSLRHWAYVFTQFPFGLESFKTSLLAGVMAATLATAVGLIVSYRRVKTHLPGRQAADLLVFIPFATPGVVLALALIVTWSGRFVLNLYGTFTLLVLAYAIKYLAHAARIVAVSLEQIHPSLEEAGQGTGAGKMRVFRDITLPLAKPGIIAAWFGVFILSFYELTMSVLLNGPYTRAIGVTIYELQTYDDPQSASVLASVVIFLVLAASRLLFHNRQVAGGQPEVPGF